MEANEVLRPGGERNVEEGEEPVGWGWEGREVGRSSYGAGSTAFRFPRTVLGPAPPDDPPSRSKYWSPRKSSSSRTIPSFSLSPPSSSRATLVASRVASATSARCWAWCAKERK